MGALGAGQRDGSGAEFGVELALDLPGAVAEPPGEPGYAFAVHHAVADQPHGPADDVGTDVPLGRAGHGVGAAPPAGRKPPAWAAAAVG